MNNHQRALEIARQKALQIAKHWNQYYKRPCDSKTLAQAYLDLTARYEALADFLHMVLEETWHGGDIDAGEVQTYAEKHGLLQQVVCTEENIDEWPEFCNDVGDYYYTIAPEYRSLKESK